MSTSQQAAAGSGSPSEDYLITQSKARAAQISVADEQKLLEDQKTARLQYEQIEQERKSPIDNRYTKERLALDTQRSEVLKSELEKYQAEIEARKIAGYVFTYRPPIRSQEVENLTSGGQYSVWNIQKGKEGNINYQIAKEARERIYANPLTTYEEAQQILSDVENRVRGYMTPVNVETNYAGTLAARQQGYNVGSGLSKNLPETFQKDFDKRFVEHNKLIGLTENITTERAKQVEQNAVQSTPVQPQNPRPHILTGQPDSKYANPEFAQKGSPERQGIKPKEIDLVENINAITGAPLSSAAPRAENLSGTLFNIAPKKPKSLSQEQVNALSPAAYAEYRKEFENYNTYVIYQNEKIKQQNAANIITNREAFQRNREAFAKYLSEAKAAGIKFVNIETKSGVQTIPIDKALQKKGVIGISAVPNVPEGFTAGYVAGELIAIPEGRQFVGPEKPVEQNYAKNIGDLFGAEALSIPKGFEKYQYEKGRVTSEKVPIVTKSYKSGPITTGIENLKSPLEKGAEFVEGLGTGLLRTSMIGYHVAETALVGAQTKNPFVGEEVLQKHEQELKKLGVGPAAASSVESGIPTGRSAYYNVGELVGEYVIPFVPFLKGQIKNPFSRSPIKPKVPQTEAPEIAKTSTNSLNDLYREPLKLETPEQGILRQAKRERIVQARVKELTELGAEKILVRFNPKTEKIDYQISQVPLGEGSGFITKGVPNPRFTVSGEAPESTQLKELQKKNILENEKKGELSDVLSSDTMNRLSPKESPFKVISENEVNELKELQKKNILENEKKGELSDVLSSNTMNRLTPKEAEFKIITEREANELKELKRRRTEPAFLETNVEVGRGTPNILRISGGKITETPKGGPFTFIEKVANLRKNPELEEREPFKFYIKKELGYPESEPIDMTGRIDLGFEKVDLGHGTGFITKGVPNPRFTVSGEAPESTQLKELQKKNILENEKKGELSDVLSSDTMNRLSPKESPFKVISENEVNELKELQKKNILEKKKPELLLKAKEENEPVPLKIDLRKQIQEDLFKKAGFKKIASISLGEGKGEVITISGAGAGAIAPLPLVIAETEDEKRNPITNATETNGTITNGTSSLPVIVSPSPPAETSAGQQQGTSSVFAAAQTTPTGLAYGLEAAKTRRTRAQQMLERKSIQKEKEKQAFLIINPVKESSKNKAFLGFAQPQGLKQPQRLNSIFPTPQMPTVKLAPISLQTEKQKQKQTTKEPPGFGFRFTKPRESRKEKARKDKLDAFVGNVSDVDIGLGFNRKEITSGVKASEKRYQKDIRFAYKRGGFKKLITQHEGSILSKKKRSILEREKPKEVKRQKKKTGGFF